ncbi:MAG: ComEC/Rec2 family competence protein [Bacteroidota bacterium]
MNSWRPYPLLRLLFPFLAGIIIGTASGAACKPLLALPALVTLVVAARIILLTVSGYRYRWIAGLLINGFFLAAGFEISCQHAAASDPAHFSLHPGGTYLVTLGEPPAMNRSPVKAILEVRYRRQSGRWVRTCGRALGYLKLPPKGCLLQYGDYLLLRAGFTAITDNSNPHSFNYAAYLQNQGITHRVFAGEHGWRTIGITPAGIPARMAFRLRERLLGLLRENRMQGREFAVAAALLLGYVDEIDAGLRNDYAATGAMHILSVSGMHVGIIYLFLEFLLGFLKRNKAGRYLKTLILILFIWFYALLTGMSPAVLRSAAMLSLPILGRQMGRSPDMFNIVAASVILLLAIDPLLITDVGFQLSYLAVMGIVVLYKPIYDLYVTSSWLPDKVWSIVAVSLAAQLATMPITLFTFHQFPVYFMVTNIFVVPLSSLIIYFGIVVLAVGNIPFLGIFTAKVLIFLVWLLNSSIHFIEELPGSVIRGIFISLPEMLLLYAVILAGFLFFTRRVTAWLWILLVAALLLNGSLAATKLERLHSRRLLVFNIPHAALYEVSCQDRALVFGDHLPGMSDGSRKICSDIIHADFSAHGIRLHRDYWIGRSHPDRPARAAFMPVIHLGRFIQAGKCRIAILGKPPPKGFNGQICVDYLVISGNPNLPMADIMKVFRPRGVIIDASNSRFRTAQWLREAALLRVSCHAVTISGAFEKDF